MQMDVTMQLSGADVRVGTLFTEAKRGVETASFRYDAGYLADPRAFPLAPDMPLTHAPLHARGMFAAFSDAMPDRWGRTLLQRAELRRAALDNATPRSLFEADYLAGVADETRQGALRFWIGGAPVSPVETGVPKEVAIPHLLGETYALEEDAAADIKDLLDAGSSLGGARPKASVEGSDGTLMVAKFPKKSESLLEDTCAWEYVALKLASHAGIRVPPTKLLRIQGKAVLLLERFDRCTSTEHAERTRAAEHSHGIRIPYMSAMTAIQGAGGETHSYLEIVDFLERYGSQPEDDITELWSRIAYSCLIGNTDDHMRNHGFLWDGKGWRLSPAFDINPTAGCGEKFLSNAIDLDDTSATAENALRGAAYYRLKPAEAGERLNRILIALAQWQRAAKSCGISAESAARMRSCFDAAASGS